MFTFLDSTYRNALSQAVLMLQQNGKIAELKRRWWEERKGGGQCNVSYIMLS